MELFCVQMSGGDLDVAFPKDGNGGAGCAVLGQRRLEVNGEDGGDEGRTTTADRQSAPEVRLALAEAQATPEAAAENLELHEVTGNAGGDEGRITTAGPQVAPRGAGRRPPLRGQRQAPEPAGGFASRHQEGSSGGPDQDHLRSLAMPLGGPMARG